MRAHHRQRTRLGFRPCPALLAAAIALGLALCPAGLEPARADLLEVDSDGGKPYTVLQDALNAAATGDTILVHPGLYRQWTERWHGGAYRRAVGFIESGVTILGISHGSVINPPDLVGSVGLYSVTAESVTVRNLRVRGTQRSTGIFPTGFGSTLIESCLVEGTRTGVITGGASTRTWVRNTEFVNTAGVASSVYAHAIVSNCRLTTSVDDADLMLVVDHQGTALMHDVEIDGGSIVQANSGGQAEVHDVTASGSRTAVLVRDPGSSLTLTRVTAYAPDTSLHFSAGVQVLNFGQLDADHIKLIGMTRAFRLAGGGTIRVNSSSILDWAEWAVHTEEAYDPPQRDWNFTNNWWGMADSVSIADAIWDGLDDPVVNQYGIVDFWPASDRSVSGERIGVGRVKGRFHKHKE